MYLTKVLCELSEMKASAPWENCVFAGLCSMKNGQLCRNVTGQKRGYDLMVMNWKNLARPCIRLGVPVHHFFPLSVGQDPSGMRISWPSFRGDGSKNFLQLALAQEGRGLESNLFASAVFSTFKTRYLRVLCSEHWYCIINHPNTVSQQSGLSSAKTTHHTGLICAFAAHK